MPGQRNRHSLEDLGLDFLMEIDPEDAVWRNDIQNDPLQLTSSTAGGSSGKLQKAVHVLEAHQVLSETNEKNQRAFSTVVTLLETELEEKKKLAETPKEK